MKLIRRQVFGVFVACCQKTNLKHSNDGPEERVKVFPVRDGVAALRPEAEFAAKQMHAQDAAAKKQATTRRNDQPVAANT